VLLHQLGDNLIFTPELLPEGGDGQQVFGLGRIGLVLEGGGAVLEELALPGVEDGGPEMMLVAAIGDGHPVDQVPAQDGDLLGRGVVLAGLAHGVFLPSESTLTLGQENSDSG
jgi:hypothetical protein